jgi:hypothetical protein
MSNFEIQHSLFDFPQFAKMRRYGLRVKPALPFMPSIMPREKPATANPGFAGECSLAFSVHGAHTI